MTADHARIFISYSRKDGADAASTLRHKLEGKGLAVWQDLVALEGGRDWWSQIEAALKSKQLQHFILIVTPKSLESHVVRREMRLARQEGKTFLPVKGPGLADLNSLPRWVGQLTDFDIPEHCERLERQLWLPSMASRVPMMAPEPPADFVSRPAQFEALKRQLLDSKGDAVGITAALRGAGGYGKTTLAKALAHDPDIRDAYLDGVLWVELGENGGDRILPLINDLTAMVEGHARTMTTVDAARAALGEALGDRRILLVVDDVWQRHHLEPFLHGGPLTTRLVTTRFDPVLPQEAVRQPVDAMQDGEALLLLGYGLPSEQVMAQAKPLTNIAARLGEWAQLLKLANGFLRDRVVKHRVPLDRALADLSKRFDARGLDALSTVKNIDYRDRHSSASKVINTTLELLDDDKQARFAELGIFPEDVDVPFGIAGQLWAEAGDLDELATEDLLGELYGLSLLLSLDHERRTFRFHDTTRQFLQDEAKRKGQLAAQHKKLIQAMGDMGNDDEAPAADLDYFYRYLPEHLAGAGDRETLNALLLDPRWLKAKLAATESTFSLVADYERHAQGQLQSLIGRTLRLISGILTRDSTQMLQQLHGRLMPWTDPISLGFLDATRTIIPPPALMTIHPSLTPPGAEITRLGIQNCAVRSLAVLADGLIAAGYSDHKIRLWDLRSGLEVSQLVGHSGPVNALHSPTGNRLISGGEDRIIFIWDVAINAAIDSLEVDGSVNYLAMRNGDLVSSEYDNSIHIVDLRTAEPLIARGPQNIIRLWDLRANAQMARNVNLDPDSCVSSLAVLRDGRIAAGTVSGAISLTDPPWLTDPVAHLLGHRSTVTGLALMSGGELASSSHDGTIRLWDLSAGTEISVLRSTHRLECLQELDRDHLVSGTASGVIHVWNPTGNQLLSSLRGHVGTVNAMERLPDGSLLSGGSDGTIRHWDTSTEASFGPVSAHIGPVLTVAVMADGRLASGGKEGSIRIWDPVSGLEIERLGGHKGPITSLASLPIGKLGSGSADGTIRVWDMQSGEEPVTLEFDEEVTCFVVKDDGRLAVTLSGKSIQLCEATASSAIARFWSTSTTGLVETSDGKLAASSLSKTIRIWDPTSGEETSIIKGHAPFTTVLALRDRRVASGSADGAICLWDTIAGSELERLHGHESRVTALGLLRDDLIASASTDSTIRLWDFNNKIELCRLEVDAPVLCLAILSNGRLVAGDANGRLHWLEIIE